MPLDYVVLVAVVISYAMLLLDFAWNSKLYFEPYR